MLRFKTEEEFVKEFGDDWDVQVRNGWCERMDHLFGKILSEEHESKFSRSGFFIIDGWDISPDMVTTTRVNRRKRVRINVKI